MTRTRAEMKEAKLHNRLFRTDEMIETTENWYPNYNEYGKPADNGKFVRLSLLKLPGKFGWRVCVWGADDTGVEIDYTEDEWAAAKEMFDLVKGGGPVTRADLRMMGFINA